MAVAVLGFSVMAEQSYHDLQRSPIITYDSNPTLPRDVPHPAVSICGPWIAPKGTRKLLNKLRVNRTSEQESLDFEAAMLLCGLEREEPYAFRNYSHVWDLYARLSEIHTVIYDGSETVHHGVYPHIDGYCVTANTQERGILTREVYGAEVLIDKGKRLLTNENYLRMEIYHDTSERDKLCDRPNVETKYQVYVHDPGDYSGNKRGGGISATHGRTTYLDWYVKDAVEPMDEVFSVPLHRRKCFYPHEAPRLMFFNQYTPDNCLTECRVKEDLKRYGCVNKHWPIHPVSQNVCHFYGMWEPLPKGVISGEPCDCLQLCSHLVYALQQLRQDQEDGFSRSTNVEVYRQIHTFTKKIRSVVITDTGFLDDRLSQQNSPSINIRGSL